MPRKPALTFAGALRILGKHESKAVERLDKVLGGGILASGAASLLVDGGASVLFAALWGWVDQKNEATKLLRELVGKLSGRAAGTKGVERRDLIIAAHSTIVAAAFFEVLDERLGPRRVRELAVTDEEKRQLVTDDAQDCHDSLYLTEIPAPSPSRGFEENLEHLARWIDARAEETGDFLTGLAGGENTVQVFGEGFREQVLDRYQSYYLALAATVPEFVFWAVLGEHAATRERIEGLGSDLRAVLDAQGRALAQAHSLLGLLSNRDAVVDKQREGLRKANVGVLGKPVVPSDTERYDTDIVFPTIERAFVTPHYRMAAHDKESRPADDHWWDDQPLARDLELMLAAHFTSADATTLPMLLLGHPGAGKSMLTKVLAARLPAEEYTVVRVPLRSVSAGASISDQLQQALDIASNSRLRWQDLSDRADTVLVVLLDGLDELLQAADFDRSGYLREVVEFQRIEEEQNGRPVAVVVTSRTVVADRVDVPPGTTVVKLEEFDDDQIAAWLREWRAANLATIRTGVVRELTAVEALHHPHLARQPLLLLMLALYAADPQLPKLDADLSKAALYERIFDSFARREVRKRAGGSSELERRVVDQVFRLAVAALAMFNRGAQSVRENDLRADLVALTGQDDLPGDEGARLLGEFFFVHAPEAVVRTTERAYEFLHATFGEYLVARHVIDELAGLANAAYGGRYGGRTLNDELLFALLSHHALGARASIGEFAQEMFAVMPGNEQDDIRRALVDLLRSFRQRRRSTQFETYRPTPLDFVRQLAAYSANLTTLSIRFSDPEVGVRLVDVFGDDEAEALANWRSMLSLWRSGLDRDDWLGLLYSLKMENGTILVNDSRNFAPFDIPGGDEYCIAMVGGDRRHASRIRHGIAFVDRSLFFGYGPSWADEALPWLRSFTFEERVHVVRNSFFLSPPEKTSEEDIESVYNALLVALQVRTHEFPENFVIDALREVVKHRPFCVSRGETLRRVLDEVEPTIFPELRPQWEELRDRFRDQDTRS
ncbi:NACHT domain-containing protein [Actinosynnema mirum]|uniref:Putative signal transduction protein with Nacht domain n=1 Tax=Actinosynnema mirum (strain ATCC 29888 / DSM 43827 / JCM 3225 / NBRC 14064 / NCIMB 13271 / NRRL B-12336 / IMRU 3971 / 101) TaxID=446462 RepID=C6WIV8_ACTMD|nr:AAA family ATPase [Actinosynnema mirum]ACU38198.1 putative signal transduction protein with Nacht domain [Actinosynnema mirum DSM 43827]